MPDEIHQQAGNNSNQIGVVNGDVNIYQGDGPRLSALSTTPRTTRPLLNIPLIGRQEAWQWLTESSQDCLLVGQPGSGKTFLFYRYAQNNGAMFVVDYDRQNLAASIQAQQPTAILLDDAHMYQETLMDLIQIRREFHGGFRIITSCWPGEQQAIANALTLPASEVHTLQLLTRDEIVDVIKAVGVHGGDLLIHEILEQAEGLPGLAVTMADLCLKDDIQRLIQGEILSASFLPFFEQQVGQQAKIILAGFAIGGDTGMGIEAVSQSIGLPKLDVLDALNRLATGGVIHVHPKRYYSVRPPILRYALIRDVLFSEVSLPIEPFLSLTPNLAETANTLIYTKARGAEVPDTLLLSVVSQADQIAVWKNYAYLGYKEAILAIKAHPEAVTHLSRPALRNASSVVIPLLLQLAVGDQRELHMHPEHPLRQLTIWVEEAYPETDGIARRETLLHCIENWARSSYDPQTAIRAGCIALSPGFKVNSVKPGSGKEWTSRFGILSPQELIKITTLWPRILTLLQDAPEFIEEMRSVVYRWRYPNPAERSEEIYQMMMKFAVGILRDLLQIEKIQPHSLHWIRQISWDWELDLAIPVERDFAILYPLQIHDDWQNAEQAQRLLVEQLASEWGKQEPDDVIRRLISIEAEAKAAKLTRPRWTLYLCTKMASNVNDPAHWVRVMLDHDIDSDMLFPFLHRALELHQTDCRPLISECFQHKTAQIAVVSIALTSPLIPDDIENAVFGLLDKKYAGMIETLLFRNQVPEATLIRLLQHENLAIVTSAAKGMWEGNSQHQIPTELVDDWIDIVVKYIDDEYWLREAFAQYHIAYRWLAVRLQDPTRIYGITYEQIVISAVQNLSVSERIHLLRDLPDTFFIDSLVGYLVGDNLDLYQELLNLEHLKSYHLVPLMEDPNENWVKKAKLAASQGYTPDQIAYATFSQPSGTITISSGNESDRWRNWVAKFDTLSTHEDKFIQSIAHIGKSYADEALKKAAKNERDEEVYGI